MISTPRFIRFSGTSPTTSRTDRSRRSTGAWSASSSNLPGRDAGWKSPASVDGVGSGVRVLGDDVSRDEDRPRDDTALPPGWLPLHAGRRPADPVAHHPRAPAAVVD